MKLKKIALFVTTTLALFTAVPRVSADSNVQKVIDETYVKRICFVFSWTKVKSNQTLVS